MLYYVQHVLGKAHSGYDYRSLCALAERTIMGGAWHETLTFIEILTQRVDLEFSLARKFQGLLNYYSVAYHIVGKGRNVWIVPRTSREGGDVIARRIGSLFKSRAPGTNTHIQSAIQNLNGGHYREAVRESITAVESMLRVIAQESGGHAPTLGKALKLLDKQSLFPNEKFRNAIEALYIYTNSTEGIRHATLSGDNNVTHEEPTFASGFVC